MPQLDFSTFPSQIFWLTVTFVILYVLMAKLALPKVGAVLAQRRARIDGDLERAGQMKAEAEAVMAAYERSLADARAQAQATLRETMERFNVEAAKHQREAAEKLAREAAAAERRIGEAKAQALADLRGVAVDIARATSLKLVGLDIDESRAATAVDQVMKERA
jgi:F-type H+-transporting ATPase subunit b